MSTLPGVATRVLAAKVLDAVVHRGRSLKAELGKVLPQLPDPRELERTSRVVKNGVVYFPSAIYPAFGIKPFSEVPKVTLPAGLMSATAPAMPCASPRDRRARRPHSAPMNRVPGDASAPVVASVDIALYAPADRPDPFSALGR